MTKQLEFYKCDICGNIVQVFHQGNGELVCCEKSMVKLEAKTQETELTEKHVPYFENSSVRIGSILHPMKEEHHIEFIQCSTDDGKITYTKFLNENDEPKLNLKDNILFNNAVEYCNIHGLWAGSK